MKLREKKLASKNIFKGRILTLDVDTVELPNGRQANREVVAHPGAVGIVPLTVDGRIIMVRQYRYPIDAITLEIPAGKLDPGEAPDDCARRELEEETGFTAGRLQKLTAVYTSPGFSNELIHLYLAEELHKTAQNLDADEFINVEYYPVSQILQLIKDGTITDAKSVAGILAARLD